MELQLFMNLWYYQNQKRINRVLQHRVLLLEMVEARKKVKRLSRERKVFYNVPEERAKYDILVNEAIIEKDRLEKIAHRSEARNKYLADPDFFKKMKQKGLNLYRELYHESESRNEERAAHIQTHYGSSNQDAIAA
jgi:hypothetical protein